MKPYKLSLSAAAEKGFLSPALEKVFRRLSAGIP